MTTTTSSPLTWAQLEAHMLGPDDLTHGPTHAKSRLRLFGQQADQVRVTLYRDHHAWCPYCQKVWLWLEEKQLPYRVSKVTMFCYGQKEAWYRKRVPSGMLPALELDGRLITESDDILLALEAEFGPLGPLPMRDPVARRIRNLERTLFRAWCRWLCQPMVSKRQDDTHAEAFQAVVDEVEAQLQSTPGPFMLDTFSTMDVVFTPYVERMHASLYYYKGYALRDTNTAMGRWFDAMEARMTYRGTQSDFHTHVHDLPPQMGGCWSNDSSEAKACQHRVDEGPWEGLPEANYPEPETSRREALTRVMQHRERLIEVNPGEAQQFAVALRCALTRLIAGEACRPPQGSDSMLRYLRDRISVPRDMSLYAARRLREALEDTAAMVGAAPGPPIPVRHRRDQNPAPFLGSSGEAPWRARQQTG
ncbi:MAG: glutathione S-transferase family protein [Myxococcota bacterium]